MIFTLNIKYRILNFILSTFSHSFSYLLFIQFFFVIVSDQQSIAFHVTCFIFTFSNYYQTKNKWQNFSITEREWNTFFTKKTQSKSQQSEKRYFSYERECSKKKNNATWSAKQKILLFIVVATKFSWKISRI
jgi:hypothetical protein